MKINKKVIIVFNVITGILFLIPVFKLDLLYENYSTLSLTTRGYYYLLFLGLLIGSLLSYETYITSKNKIRTSLMFLSLFIGVIIPHHVPYNLQGNLHLLFAYIGFAGLVIITTINTYLYKEKYYYFLLILLSILIYLKYGIVNTLSEIIVMISSLFINLRMYIKNED